MARQKANEKPAFKSWVDVNEALRQMALEEIAISDIESAMEKQIIGIKKCADIESQPHQDRIKSIVKEIQAFTDENIDEFSKKKTVSMIFGDVGYRLSTKITLPKAKDKIRDIIRRLRERKMNDCVVTKESINKDILKQYGEDRVLAVGAGWKQKDEFWCEASKDKIDLKTTF